MKLDPNALIDPVLLFFLALMAGTLVVIVPNNPVLGEQDPEPPVVVRAPTQAAAPVVDERAWSELRALSSQIATLRHSLQELRFEASRLDAAARALPEVPAPALPQAEPPEFGSLRTLLASQEEELARLKIEFEKTRPPFEGDSTSAPLSVKSDKATSWFGLVADRVLPVADSHYQIRRVRVVATGAIRTMATPSKPGETLEEALRPGSVFLKELGKLDPKKHVVTLNVDKESYGLFRKIREQARQRGFDVAWDPDLSDDGSIVFAAGGSGTPVLPQR